MAIRRQLVDAVENLLDPLDVRVPAEVDDLLHDAAVKLDAGVVDGMDDAVFVEQPVEDVARCWRRPAYRPAAGSGGSS